MDTRNDQFESGEEAPTTSPASAMSISWTCDDISLHIVPFTGDYGIKIPLSVTDMPFS